MGTRKKGAAAALRKEDKGLSGSRDGGDAKKNQNKSQRRGSKGPMWGTGSRKATVVTSVGSWAHSKATHRDEGYSRVSRKEAASSPRQVSTLIYTLIYSVWHPLYLYTEMSHNKVKQLLAYMNSLY